jgi:tRNA 2-thiouridine synthesizing protein A
MFDVIDELEELDLRGLKCPMPALLARRRLAARGTTPIAILADDPMAVIDIPHMCHREGHEIVEMTREGNSMRFVLVAGHTPKKLQNRLTFL